MTEEITTEMGYPSSTRKLADNKRYYYSNNPNKRRQNPYIKKTYPRSYSGGYTYHSSADFSSPLHSAPTTPLIQGPPTSKPHLVPQGDAVRPSRYGPKPHVPNKTKPTQILPKTRESRYNPDNETSLQARSLSGSLGNQERQSASGAEANKSRYSGSSFSRYNSRGGSPPSTSSHTASPSLPASSHYPPWRHSQRSLDPINTDFSYNYSPYHAKPSSSSGFFSRSSKWRSSGLRGSVSGDSSASSDVYFKGSPYSQRPPYWKYNRSKLSNPNLTALGQPQQFPERRHSQGDHNVPSSRSGSNCSEIKLGINDTEPKQELGFRVHRSKSSEIEYEEPKSELQPPDHSVDAAPVNIEEAKVQSTSTNPEEDVKIEEEGVTKVVTVETENITEEVERNNEDVNNSSEISPQDEDVSTVVKKEEEDVKYNICESIHEEKLDEPPTTDEQCAEELSEEREEIKRESSIPSPQEHDSELYTYISDPKLLRGPVPDLQQVYPLHSYPEPRSPIDEYIFPMKELDMRLWMLKNSKRCDIVSKQKYLLENPIKNFEDYPFMQQNIQDYKQKYRMLLQRALSSVRSYETLKKIKLKKQFFQLSHSWEESCQKLQETSENLRSEEIEFDRQRQMVYSEKKKELQKKNVEQEKVFNSFRRRNRADFVDDAEMEAVLLQIEPDYKHYRAAASIPPMKINPLEKYSLRCADVNNLITDKDKWASRLLTDGVDNFTSEEHELFVEAFMSQPKKFGKISHIMGGLRSPEECVLHYYRTKKSVDYKGMLLERTKKRKNSGAKRRRRREKSNNVFDEDMRITPAPSVSQPIIHKKNVEPVTPSGGNTGFEDEYNYSIDQVESTSSINVPNGSPVAGVSKTLYSNQQRSLDHPGGGSPTTESEKKLSTLATKERKTLTQAEEQDSGAPITPKKRPYDVSYETDQEYSDSTPSKAQSVHGPSSVIVSPSKSGGHPLPESNTSRPKASPHDKTVRKKVRNVSDHKSSYWSVKESQLFPELLRQHGSRWDQISEKLGTKSTTMVRNYYQRNAAQYGWKAIVEESDMKRNIELSSSVRQGQILLQPEQPAAPPSVIDGLPPQQVPTLGFFSNTSSEKTQLKNIEAGSKTSARLFGPDNLSDSLTAVKTSDPLLPPSNLPFVSLRSYSNPNDEGAPVGFTNRQWAESGQVATASTSAGGPISTTAEPYSRIPPFNVANNALPDLRIVNRELATEGDKLAPLPGRSVSVSGMLNTKEDGNLQVVPPANFRLPEGKVAIPDKSMVQQNDSRGPLPILPVPPRGGIVSQIPPSNPKSGSISSLLNPISNVELPQVRMDSSKNGNVETLQPDILVGKAPLQTTKPEDTSFYIPGINFANDPLAALAAVASAPETIASILPKNKDPKS